jgi:hypothetical protein
VNDFTENHSLNVTDKCEALPSAKVSDEQLSVCQPSFKFRQVMVLESDYSPQQSTHQSAFDKPVELHWRTHAASLDPRQNVLTT